MYYNRTISTRYISPEAFIYLDQKGYIQDDKNVLLIYNFPRHNNNKKLEYPQFSRSEDMSIPWRYSMALPNKKS